MMMRGGDGWFVMMWVWMAAFWLLLIAGGIWLVSRLTGPEVGARSELDRRLARGDIDLAEYDARRAALGATRRPSGTAVIIAVVALLALATLVAAQAVAAARGNWDMFDHMRRMMGDGSHTSGTALVLGGRDETVTIRGFTFTPGNLQVPVGASVTWANSDGAPHNATARDGSWKTGNLSKGERDTLTFDGAGKYDYYCTIHPSMTAHLSVR